MLARRLSYFIAVAEHCGFSDAAAALHVSQPALSQQIRQLEAMPGGSAFDRSGRRTRLTDAGEMRLSMPVARYATLRKVGAPCMTQKIPAR